MHRPDVRRPDSRRGVRTAGSSHGGRPASSSRQLVDAHDLPGQPLPSSRRSWETTMPLYLTRFRYTPETWARLINNPEDRRTAAQQYIEAVGGKLHGFWYAF